MKFVKKLLTVIKRSVVRCYDFDFLWCLRNISFALLFFLGIGVGISIISIILGSIAWLILPINVMVAHNMLEATMTHIPTFCKIYYVGSILFSWLLMAFLGSLALYEILLKHVVNKIRNCARAFNYEWSKYND